MQAYDQHLNMILGEVEETITTIEIDDETYEEIIKVYSLLHMALACLPKCLHTKFAHECLLTFVSVASCTAITQSSYYFAPH